MCLSLVKNPPKIKWNKDGKAKVYGVARIYGDTENRNFKARDVAVSWFQGAKIPFKGAPLLRKSNRLTRKLTAFEKKNKEVGRGLHVFLNFKDAKAIVAHARKDLCCVVFEYTASRQHHVATGEFDGLDSAVFTRLKLDQIAHANLWNTNLDDTIELYGGLKIIVNKNEKG